TEIVNKWLETTLRAFVAENKETWSEWLKLLEFAYNAHVSQTTGCAPFDLLMGFRPTSPLD
ncbi:hypothetical protein BDZ89DRAFT_922025, partial [Hymenopellis radicata]